MEKFTKLTAVAAPLPMVNVDTDMIIPKQFLKTIKRTGLGSALFHGGVLAPHLELSHAPVRRGTTYDGWLGESAAAVVSRAELVQGVPCVPLADVIAMKESPGGSRGSL